jgi:hypothetical protein
MLIWLVLSVGCSLPQPKPWIVLVEENHVLKPAGHFKQVIEWSWSPDQCKLKPESWTHLEKWEGRKPDIITYTSYDPEVKARNWWGK